MSTWAACLSSAVAGWRGRYNASATFVAGTFAAEPAFAPPSELGGGAVGPKRYADFLRRSLGGYGPGFRGYYYPYAPLPFAAAQPLGLADAYYDAGGGEPFAASPAPSDAAAQQNWVHFSSRGYDVMGMRYYQALQRAGAARWAG